VFQHLFYGREIYGNTFYSYLNKLEKLYNKILRILQNKPIKTHIIELYKRYETLPLSLLHNYQILLFVHKFTYYRHKLPDVFASYFTQNSFIHQHNTRIKSNFFVTCIHTIFGKRALTYKGPALWNNLPNDLIMFQSTTTFKLKPKNYLTDKIYIQD